MPTCPNATWVELDACFLDAADTIPLTEGLFSGRSRHVLPIMRNIPALS